MFSSPLTGRDYNVNYSRMGFEADLPRIEPAPATGPPGGLHPDPDDRQGTPAAFYPYFSALRRQVPTSSSVARCRGRLAKLPGGNDFGANAQYGSLLSTTYLTLGGGGDR